MTPPGKTQEREAERGLQNECVVYQNLEFGHQCIMVDIGGRSTSLIPEKGTKMDELCFVGGGGISAFMPGFP